MLPRVRVLRLTEQPSNDRLTQLLQLHQIDVENACSCEDAVRRLSSGQFQVALTDAACVGVGMRNVFGFLTAMRVANSECVNFLYGNRHLLQLTLLDLQEHAEGWICDLMCEDLICHWIDEANTPQASLRHIDEAIELHLRDAA